MLFKMIICFSLLLLSYAAFSNPSVLVGDSQEVLLELQGTADDVLEKERQGITFVYYYYQHSDLTFVVNKESWEVCDIAQGQGNGGCFPCDKDEESENCQ